MSVDKTVARPYAKAAFEYSASNNSIENWKSFIEHLCLIKDNSNVLEFEKSSSVNSVYNYFSEILNGLYSQEYMNFLLVIIENKRFSVINEIYSIFCDLCNEYKKQKIAKVYSCNKLNNAVIEKIKCKLKNKYFSDIIIENYIDKSLIAGFIIKIEDEVFDCSLKGRLESFSNALR